jgi:acetyl esterase/lipase
VRVPSITLTLTPLPLLFTSPHIQHEIKLILPISPVGRTIFGFFKRCLPFNTHYILTWRQKLAISALRALRFTLNTRQKYAYAHRILTGDIIRAQCASSSLQHRQVRVPIHADIVNGATESGNIPGPMLHFITLDAKQTDGKTLFYCHGGGYLDPMIGPAHFPMVQRMAAACNARQIVFLEYTLMPYIEYPGQLIQVVEAVRMLLNDEDIAPEDLILGGDSAGGHLITSLVAHITTPCPGVPTLDVAADAQFGAAVLLSPWLTMKGTDPVALANASHDYLSPDRIGLFAELLRTNPEHVWVEPVDAPGAQAVWKAAFPPGKPEQARVKRVLVTAGSAEVILQNCQIFAVKYLDAETVIMAASGKENKAEDLAILQEKPAVFALGLGEVHVQPALDASVGCKGSTAVAIETFLESL